MRKIINKSPWKKFPRFFFTIIELLVVVAIISVLITLLLPALNKAKGLAKRSACAANLKQMGIAAINYSTDFNDYLPCTPRGTWDSNQIIAKGTDTSYPYFCNEYLGSPVKYSGMDILGVATNPDNAVIRCPAAKTPDNPCWDIEQLRYCRSSYPSPGFTPYGRDKHTRISSLARKGSRNLDKIMFADHVSTKSGAYFYLNHNFHGGNFSYADGRVSWTPRNNLVEAGNSGSIWCWLPKGTQVLRTCLSPNTASELLTYFFWDNGSSSFLVTSGNADKEFF